MQSKEVIEHIVSWLRNYSSQSTTKGFIVGISGGVDSALVGHLCVRTNREILLLNMPIRQHSDEYMRAKTEIEHIQSKYKNVRSLEVNLTANLELLEHTFGAKMSQNQLMMANTRSRLRMLTLYAYGQENNLLVAGTGNKIEDFGIGFFTKYGDGGVDISPIGDLLKTEVYQLAEAIGVSEQIIKAKPTDGLWDSTHHDDESQIGASYPELEWAMNFQGDETTLNGRKKEVLAIYRRFNRQNQHKMQAIPVCKIPEKLK